MRKTRTEPHLPQAKINQFLDAAFNNVVHIDRRGTGLAQVRAIVSRWSISRI